MHLETRVEKLEEHHKQMDTCTHGLARTCADIKNIALTNQHDIATVKSDISNLSTNLKALTDATHAGFRRADEQHNEFVKETREHFDQLETRLDQFGVRFDQFETRFDQFGTRFDQFGTRFDQLETRFDQFGTRFDQLETRFDQFGTRFDQLETRFDQLELLIRQSLANN